MSTHFKTVIAVLSGGFRGLGDYIGGCSPPPAISGNTKGWMCCYKNTKTLILANNDVLYISMYNNLYLPKGCTHHTPWYYFAWLASSYKTLRFELNTLNLTLGGISVLHKTKYPIASGGLCPQTPCFRDPLL